VHERGTASVRRDAVAQELVMDFTQTHIKPHGSTWSAPESSSGGTLQNNGGGHDSDNNGGPSDGDGNV
jgi:hypothetical protein